MQNTVYYVSPYEIVPNLYQPRKFFDEVGINELAQSISIFGIIQPLSVRRLGENRYELVAGERRLRAAKKAGLGEVPVIIVDVDDKESAAIALLENLQREDLNYLEEAEAFYNLIKEHSYTQEQLAKEIGKKQSTIANKLRLLKLDNEIRKQLIDNNLTERHARALLKLPTLEAQIKVLDTVIKKNLNVKETELLIEKELNFINDIGKDGKKRIRTNSMNSKLYINTIKQVFDKFGIDAKYKSKDADDFIEVTVRIPKNN
ncbi:nucleoid occlusion protein [Clostridium cellulovorans]|uniref:ParB-like partition protein n=1 Tax=Clostridium cellulovorans (strain ATCC 35296 / DSM 3052 / OCM 3 / 743B) TaxID=573061 RepID=D9SPD2_CLOC7|nr:nucleoid occlusion protein [Clostridium cellulovorans]ADL54034.1 parB-like partition protein [Clostridium cellulovorans 743B]